jgi:hypothetical protein
MIIHIVVARFSSTFAGNRVVMLRREGELMADFIASTCLGKSSSCKK